MNAITKTSKLLNRATFFGENKITHPKQKRKQTFSKKKVLHVKRADLERSILIVAGEHSGDMLGAELLKFFHQVGFQNFIGTGGDLMRKVGMQIIEKVENMTVCGVVEAIHYYPRLKKLIKNLYAEANKNKVKIAILIDYPGFNLRLAKMLKKQGVHVVYVVSPQIWAWHYSRIKKIKIYVDLMLVLFPFEKEIYQKEGILSFCIGHPLIHRIPKQISQERKKENLPSLVKSKNKLIIALLPGSRSQEIRLLLPDMINATAIIRKYYPNTHFYLAGVNKQEESFILDTLQKNKSLGIEYIFERALSIIQASNIVIVASGTATLEVAWLKKPMVILYRSHFLNILIASCVMRVRHLGIVNLLTKKKIVPELLGSEVTPENISQAVMHYIKDAEYSKRVVEDLTKVNKKLGDGNPAKQAVRYIIDYLGKTKL